MCPKQIGTDMLSSLVDFNVFMYFMRKGEGFIPNFSVIPLIIRSEGIKVRQKYKQHSQSPILRTLTGYFYSKWPPPISQTTYSED